MHGIVPGACGGKPELVHGRPVCSVPVAQQQPKLEAGPTPCYHGEKGFLALPPAAAASLGSGVIA